MHWSVVVGFVVLTTVARGGKGARAVRWRRVVIDGAWRRGGDMACIDVLMRRSELNLTTRPMGPYP